MQKVPQVCSQATPRKGRDIEGETSFDQILANAWEDETVLPSLVLACHRLPAFSLKKNEHRH